MLLFFLVIALFFPELHSVDTQVSFKVTLRGVRHGCENRVMGLSGGGCEFNCLHAVLESLRGDGEVAWRREGWGIGATTEISFLCALWGLRATEWGAKGEGNGVAFIFWSCWRLCLERGIRGYFLKRVMGNVITVCYRDNKTELWFTHLLSSYHLCQACHWVWGDSRITNTQGFLQASEETNII